MNIICKLFGHSKSHWQVGTGSSVVFVWCSRCGQDMPNESTDTHSKVCKLEGEVIELNRVINYYKSANESLKKENDKYVEIINRFIATTPPNTDNNV